MIKKNQTQDFIRKYPDILRAASTKPLNPEMLYTLATVVSRTTVVQNEYIYKYTIQPVILDWAGGTSKPTFVSKNAGTFEAFSISELGNTTSMFSYGVDLSGITQFTNVPPTIAPQPIPTGTPVFAVAQKRNDGTFYYLIINTQAISGTCD